MSFRKKIRPKTITLKVRSKYFLKMHLSPLSRDGTEVIWLVSMGAGKSKRQLNDWVDSRKKKKNTKKFLSNLSGAFLSDGLHISGYMQVLKVLRRWCFELEPGDMMTFLCESAKPDKQYKTWNRWLSTRFTDYHWQGNEQLKCFVFYKHSYVE